MQIVAVNDVCMDRIEPLVERWHDLYGQLSGMEISGDDVLVDKIREVEQELDFFWERRRVALRALEEIPEDLLVDPFQPGRAVDDLMHVSPVC